jgi:hypothetical protein
MDEDLNGSASAGHGEAPYANEMRALVAMGFANQELDLILLKQFDGSIDRVVDILGSQ